MKNIIISVIMIVFIGCSFSANVNISSSATKQPEKEDATTGPPEAVIQTIQPIVENRLPQPQLCPTGMNRVVGEYCPEVEETCLNVDKSVHNVNGFVKCDEFGPSKCLSKERKHLDFCMDVYEYPNVKGQLPEVMMSWTTLKNNCELIGKRLCVDYEWTFACEGEDILPYPYGYKRDSSACNIDHPQKPGFDASKDVMTPEIVSYLDQRVPSGSMSDCVSPFGINDLSGNVDENVINSSGKPYKSGEKGGAWLLGHRARCRPETTAHSEDGSAFYEIGGRCCSDILN